MGRKKGSSDKTPRSESVPTLRRETEIALSKIPPLNALSVCREPQFVRARFVKPFNPDLAFTVFCIRVFSDNKFPIRYDDYIGEIEHMFGEICILATQTGDLGFFEQVIGLRRKLEKQSLQLTFALCAYLDACVKKSSQKNIVGQERYSFGEQEFPVPTIRGFEMALHRIFKAFAMKPPDRSRLWNFVDALDLRLSDSGERK